MNEENKEMVNALDYIYEVDQVVAINANIIPSLMAFLEQVIDSEPNVGALLVYPGKVEELKDEKGELTKVNIEWKEHNSNSFFFTASDQEGGVPIMTDKALRASQLLYGFTKIHEENINRGIAKKQEDIGRDDVFRA